MRAKNAMMNRPETITPRHARQRAGHAAQRRAPRMTAPQQADRRQRQADKQRLRVRAGEEHAHRAEQKIRDRQPRPAPAQMHRRQIVEQRGAQPRAEQRNQRPRREQVSAREGRKHARHRGVQREEHQPKPRVADVRIAVPRNAQIMPHIPVRPQRRKGIRKRIRPAALPIKGIRQRVDHQAARHRRRRGQRHGPSVRQRPNRFILQPRGAFLPPHHAGQSNA